MTELSVLKITENLPIKGQGFIEILKFQGAIIMELKQQNFILFMTTL